MVFELILSGLCAFVLNPCPKVDPATKTVDAVYPGGPFKYPFKDPYPVHKVNLLVETECIDPDSTLMAHQIVEVKGHDQYAVYEISGRLQVTVDGKPAALKKPDDDFHEKVTDLGKVIRTRPQLRNLRNDLLTKSGNKYGRTHIHFPVNDSGGVLLPHTIGKYEFYPGADWQWASDYVTAKWDDADLDHDGTVVIEFVNRKGEFLRLKDFKGHGAIRVIISSFDPHIGAPTTDLMHFPSYYFLSDIFSQLLMTEIYTPVLKSTDGASPSGAKPIACAICQGCGG